jgi:hypothetical protein
VNYGINQGANPDVDVASLTPAGAQAIRKERYWNELGLDAVAKQNPAMAAAAYDASINQGPGWAKEAMAKAGGDVEKFNELRRAHYDKLAQDPEHAPYAAGWNARVDDSVLAGLGLAGAGLAGYGAYQRMQEGNLPPSGPAAPDALGPEPQKLIGAQERLALPAPAIRLPDQTWQGSGPTIPMPGPLGSTGVINQPGIVPGQQLFLPNPDREAAAQAEAAVQQLMQRKAEQQATTEAMKKATMLAHPPKNGIDPKLLMQLLKAAK